MRLAEILCTPIFLLFVSPGLADGPDFNAASVKIADPNLAPPWMDSGGPGTSDPGHFRAPHIPVLGLIEEAFGVVSPDQISVPTWARDAGAGNFFTVVATMPPNTTKEQFQKMLQNLLVSRFHLVFHHETRNFPAYQLVMDKGGPKFKEATPAPPRDNAVQPDPWAIMKGPKGDDGFPKVSGPHVFGQPGPNGTSRRKYQEQPISELASSLAAMIDRSQGKSLLDGHPLPRVVDKTGLTGKYTFVLEYSDPSPQPGSFPLLQGQGNPVAGTASEPDGGGPNIFKAMQSELGLRLEKGSDVPLDVVVVDRVDKTPTEN